MMQSNLNKQALDGYGQSAIASELDYASPHRIIQMLMEGVLAKVAAAKGCIARQDVTEKGKQIIWAIDIINGLRESLDMDKGGEVAQNLDALYDYMLRKLLEANSKNDASLLDEVSTLMKEIKAGWDNIPAEYH